MDTWTTRDLPVLRAIVLGYDNIGSSPDVNEIAQTTEIEVEDVVRGIRALEQEDPPFLLGVQWSWGGPPINIGVPTGHARRAVGGWPTAESLATLLVRGLEKAAEAEPDEERKGWLRKSASYLGNAGRDIAVEISATALNKQIGL